VAADAPAPSTAPAEAPKGVAAIGGQLRLQAGRGQRVDATDLTEAVVWFVPQGAHVVRPGNYTMHTRQKGFEPAVLAVPVGSRVSFPNGDPVLHNVYSDSRGQAFDLGLYGSGQSPVHQFGQPGVVDVHCNVHRRMQAKIVVVESHLIARIGPDGRFVIEGIPRGSGRLVAWHPRGERIERLVVAGETRDLDLELPLTKHRADAFSAGARR
jgi:plastocyanin